MSEPLADPILGTGGIAGTFVRSRPVVAVTGPVGTVAGAPTVTWTYSSAAARAQASYRVRILTEISGDVLFDSGTVAGTGTSLLIPYPLSGATYRAEVTCSDGFDVGIAEGVFSVEQDAVQAFAPNPEVGVQYEIGLNGVGYMLADHPERQTRYTRRVGTLEAPRFATGDTPFSEAIERYTIAGQIDWTAGAGQRFRDRPSSSPNGFWRSEGINPFEPGQLTLLPATTRAVSSTSAVCFSVVASNELYTVTGTGTVRRLAAVGGAFTDFTITGAGACRAFVSDGTNWYYADGSNIYRNSTAADPGAAWSTENAELMVWATDRIAIATVSSGAAPDTVKTLTPSGTVETTLNALTLGSQIRSLAAGDGYIWVSASRNDKSAVYSWQLGSTGLALRIAFDVPSGQCVRGLGTYQGNVFVRTRERTSSTAARAIIYRCVPSDGMLIPSRLLDIVDPTVDHGNGTFGADDRFMLFSWRDMTADGRSGIGAVDLSTGGWSTWMYAPGDTTGEVISITHWDGRAVFSIAGYGVCVEADAPVAEGFIDLSLTDLGTGLAKIFDDAEITFDPLPLNGSVQLSYSLNGGGSYVAAGPASVNAGARSETWPLDLQTTAIGLRITLEATTQSPLVRTVLSKAHPAVLSDQIVSFVVNCRPQVVGLNGQTLTAQGTAVQRARRLESLQGTRVQFQDIDWAETRDAQTWEVVGAEVIGTVLPGRNTNRADIDYVCAMTLRRRFS